MKLRHPWLIAICGTLAAWFIRLWMSTLRYRHQPAGDDLSPNLPGQSGRYIYAFWHEDMLVPAHYYPQSDFHVLISRHADGQLIATAIKRLGFSVVYGSTTRGGAEAILSMRQIARDGHIGITPDGPRGPRRRVHPGIVYLAAKTGRPIVPSGFGYADAWRAGSWDRMALPKPFSRVIRVSVAPIHVPDTVDRDAIEAYRQQVEQAMCEATRLAQEAVTSSGRRTKGDTSSARERAA